MCQNQIKKSEESDQIIFDWDKDVVAFAVGELGLRLEEFYNMAWCEFLIKSYAYSRMQEEKLRHTRLIAYSAQIGSHLDPKKVTTFNNSIYDNWRRRANQINFTRQSRDARFIQKKNARI